MRVDHACVGSHPRQLLLDDRLVELPEERLRLVRAAVRAAGRSAPSRPTHERVVAGEDLVLAPVLVDAPELERPGDAAVVAEQLVHLLRGVGQERREEDLQAVDRAQRDVEHRRGAVAVGLDERPRGLVARRTG